MLDDGRIIVDMNKCETCIYYDTEDYETYTCELEDNNINCEGIFCTNYTIYIPKHNEKRKYCFNEKQRKKCEYGFDLCCYVCTNDVKNRDCLMKNDKCCIACDLRYRRTCKEICPLCKDNGKRMKLNCIFRL